MPDPLDDLIQRLSDVVSDADWRPLTLHWSDVETLRSLKAERDEQALRLENTRNALSLALRISGPGKPQ